MTEKQIVEIDGETYRVEITYDQPDDHAVYRFRKLMTGTVYTTSRDMCNCPSAYYRGGHTCKHREQAVKLDRARLMAHLDALNRVFVSNFPPYRKETIDRD